MTLHDFLESNKNSQTTIPDMPSRSELLHPTVTISADPPDWIGLVSSPVQVNTPSYSRQDEVEGLTREIHSLRDQLGRIVEENTALRNEILALRQEIDALRQSGRRIGSDPVGIRPPLPNPFTQFIA